MAVHRRSKVARSRTGRKPYKRYMRKKSHTPIFKAQKLWCLKAGQMPKFMKHSGSGYTTVQTPATLTGNGLGSITASNGGPVFASYQFTLGDI